MRKIIFSIGLGILMAACQQGDQKKNTASAQQPDIEDSTNYTSISWLDNNQDFGKVTEGQKVEVNFHFKNTGDKPLVIYSVRPGCGCTAAEPPKEPVLPGKEGIIKGSFDSQGRVGTNNKSIFVLANTNPNNQTLYFKVEVLKP